MKVSVALATYNGGLFLPEQLASLVGQTRLPDELVVSDDGSTDDTLDILRRFAAGAPFPVVILDKSERLGFADNFLFAAEHCRHDLIALCDQDDVWLPRKLELGAGRVEEDGSLLSMHPLTVTDETLRPTNFIWDQGIKADVVHEPLSLHPFATGWGNSMVFRKELVDLIARERRPRQPMAPEKPLSHDSWIYMLAAALGRVSAINLPLLLYRQHGQTATVAARPPARRSLLFRAKAAVDEYGERARIDREMASLLEVLAKEPGPYQEPARLASAAFERKAEQWSARRAIFEEGSIAARARAYRRFHRLNAEEPYWVGAHVKDLVMGVSGLNRRLEGRRPPQAG